VNSLDLQDTKSTYKNQLHFYTLTELDKKEIKKIIPFTITSESIKYLGIKYNQEGKNLYTENHKTFIKRNCSRPN